MKNALIAAFVVAALPAFAGTSAKNTVTPPPAAAAQSSISYDYVQASWDHLFLDDEILNSLGLDEADGYHIGFSKTLVGNLFLGASFAQTFGEGTASGSILGIPFSVDTEIETLAGSLGVGYALPISSSVHWVTTVSAVYTDADVTQTARALGLSASASASADAWGVGASTGFRFALASWLELNVFYNALYLDVDDAEVEHSGSAALIFRELLAPKLDVVLSGAVAEDAQRISAGLRYNF